MAAPSTISGQENRSERRRRDIIEELKKELDNNRLVLITGAGVTMNALSGPSGRPPSKTTWNGLIKDGFDYLVEEGYVRADRMVITSGRAFADSSEVEALLLAATILKRQLEQRSQYATWLKSVFGTLGKDVKSTTILDALKAFHDNKAVLLTTNYDDLLDKHCGLTSFDASTASHVQDFREGTEGVFHIHGCYKNPDVVVLDVTDYFGVQQSGLVRDLMRDLLLSKTILFVGCGDGVNDPNFHALLKWASDQTKGRANKHVVLLRKGDPPSHDSLRGLEYGENFSDLGPFLNSILLSSGASRISTAAAHASTNNAALLYLQERQDFLTWLEGKNQSEFHGDVFGEREDGTGSWFLDGETFKNWKSNRASLILLTGSVGSGKTVLCSSVIEQLKEETTSTTDDMICSSLAYFYCDFRDPSTMKVRTLIKSLIRQLCPRGSLPLSLQTLHRSRQDTYPRDEPSIPKLTKTLGQMITELTARSTSACDSWHVYLVIDALDEIPRGAPLDAFLDLLTYITSLKLPRLHILVTVRDDGHVHGRLRSWDLLFMDDANICVDIKKLVSSTVSKEDSELQYLSQSTHQAIRDRLASTRSGMFQWAALQLKAIRALHSIDDDAVIAALKILPDDLNETYERLLIPISPALSKIAFSALQWLVCSSRPLFMEELIDACAINFDENREESKFDEDKRKSPTRIQALLGSLVKIKPPLPSDRSSFHEKTHTVILCHFSVQEFLTGSYIRSSKVSSYFVQSDLAHRHIVASCFLYLFQCNQYTLRATSYPLRQYAWFNWEKHLPQTAEVLQETFRRKASTLYEFLCKLLSSESAPHETFYASEHEPASRHQSPRVPMIEEHTKSTSRAAKERESSKPGLSESSRTTTVLLEIVRSLPSKAASQELLTALNVPCFMEDFNEYFPQPPQIYDLPHEESLRQGDSGCGTMSDKDLFDKIFGIESSVSATFGGGSAKQEQGPEQVTAQTNKAPEQYSSHQDEHAYTRLKRGQIRLVTLLPAVSTEGNIIARVQPVTLDDGPKYDALCYTWEDGIRMYGSKVIIGGKPFPITSNLSKILRDLRKRHEHASQRIWVDSLSINMKDLEERTDQVSDMDSIYRRAQNVVVMLGDYIGNEAIGCKFLKDLVDAAFEDLDSSTSLIRPTNNIDSPISSNIVAQPKPGPLAFEGHGQLSKLATGSSYAREWTAFASLFYRPLWRRVWVVQEIVMARSVILIFGDLSLNFTFVEQVFHTVEWIERMTATENASRNHVHCDEHECAICIRHKLFAAPSWTSAKGIVYFRSLLRTTHQVPLSRILATFVNQVSSHPFDKVYALLSLATTAERRSELLRVAYDMEYTELYSRVGAHLVRHAYNLDLLSFASNWWRKVLCLAEDDEDSYNRSISNVPSWSLSAADTIARVPLYEGVFGDPLKSRPYNASGNSAPLDLEFSANYTILQLKGVNFDKIRFLDYSEHYQCGCIHSNPDVLEEFRPDLYQGQSLDEVFCRSAVADQDIDGNRLESPGSGNDSNLLANLGLPAGRLTLTDLFGSHEMDECKSYNRFLSKRQLFISEKGFVGLSPSEAQIGDEIVILPGGAIPYILRPIRRIWFTQSNSYQLAAPSAPSEEASHDFIGECYVHGIMDGQVMQEPNLKYETFRIR